ncbi:FAD/NAD(P)-binding oxidoreductase family protein [Tripterygium wilfordii]|uniref:FAD/NAD(P)-binding oxidoreductase family protein n=1 Tax=Tripterygium wilfordii TaxID=458696 RepID=A0A7J7DZJ3_TRIWF|nr:FAD/NAD(P)-binding oxidoreductase family protein [Tripterygium wilfordii]
MKQQEQQGLVGEKRRVVVVGGGIAGSLVAKSLQFTADVTLVDPKEYFEITWASLRPMVEPSFGEKSVINHKDYLTNGRTFASSVTNITDSHVLIAEGRLIPYDYLVIATGHKDPVPKTKTKRLDQFKAENEKITSAQSILIVGGGPTGVELAGEIAVDYPDKKVTLVHKGSRSKKVDVKLEQSVDLSSISDGGKIYQTSSGEPIEADCVFVCTGKPLSSAWLKGTILKDNLDEHGRLMVDGNLRVKGRENIFAIGDITGIHEIKQGYLAQEHASVAAKNIKLSMAGGKESKMATYKASSSGLAIVSLGRKEAVAQFPFTTMIGCIPGMIKSRDLFVGKTRKKMGLEA